VATLEAKGEDLQLAEVKAEIKRHSAELDALHDALPSGIAVGIAFINSLKVCRGRGGGGDVDGARTITHRSTAACCHVHSHCVQAPTCNRTVGSMAPTR
jgi:hypothetical protein